MLRVFVYLFSAALHVELDHPKEILCYIEQLSEIDGQGSDNSIVEPRGFSGSLPVLFYSGK